MTLLEYAEYVSPIPLTYWQKKFLEEYEMAKKENRFIAFSMPRNEGREMISQIIDDFSDFQNLKECRCSCGRLLGRFGGQAEIKCSKCNKINVVRIN